jgi:hypothetical protein
MSTKHEGGCHCGAVRYSVEIDPTATAIVCNCSMCGRSGTMLQFVGADKFKLEKGADNLTSYKFNKHVIDHLFCKTCGIKSFARGKDAKGNETAAINVRCLDGVNAFDVPTKQYDGKAK